MNTISLVIIDTESYELANRSIRTSISQFDFNEILIFTDDETKWSSGKIIKIEKITEINQYNKIILKDLHIYLNSDFALITQYDGFILNGTAFDSSFYNFDYIGACWNTQSHGLITGNGGFSLRSRKLINACGKFSEFDYETAEDISICWDYREYFEKLDIKFSPPYLANKFSKEHIIIGSTFGFHGLFHLPIIYKNEMDFLVDNLPERVFKNHSSLKRLTKIVGELDLQVGYDFRNELIRKIGSDFLY